ncbi:MAG TPA: phosphoenolpyruvate carboxylase, partial [Actinomycetota bacterium]|nr:phosphoenolpyruvate carboxylase [Actinomycetota bacterium]
MDGPSDRNGGRLEPGREDSPERLHRDVEALSGLLTDVLAEAGGEELVRDVELVRGTAAAFRARPTPERGDELRRLVAGLDLERAAVVARAFTVQFHLANLAEERHRVRVLRARGRRDVGVPEGIADAVALVRSSGEGVLERQLEELLITPVLTAHPTEARRRAIVDCLRRIAALLDHAEDPRAPWAERRQVERRLREAITELWRTDHVRSRRPEPLDEV